ncbi:kinesin-like protein KIN-12F isoform X2 [Triticum dicoccoides]|nr:kinesin-like protein KIN-12F isoform X2 [Triticum dicoccoides]
MVENCMAGYNSCVFAYGQTGSGKTDTMLGEISELGVKPGPECGMTPRIFEFLIARIRAEEESRRDENLKYNCECSFLEIYNEQITDLLDPSSTNLQLREDTRVGVYVENVTKREVTCVSDIITLLMQGSANRKVSMTHMNHASSRSHSVLTCTIESRWEKDSISNTRFARLNIVDLAGSERQTSSGAEGERLKEASNINKSLSTLSHVIMSLVDLTHGKKRHVPYRDSRLTFLLQDSLGGNSKTLIIANVSPSLCSSNGTLSTLKFAQRARLIQNNAVVNEDAIGDVHALQDQIHVLKEELAVINLEHVPRTHGALETEEQRKAEVVCHLCKDRESAICELQMLRSQFTKLLQEKENAEECHLWSQRTIKDLSSEVLELKSEIIDKEKGYEARMKELEIDMQEKDCDATTSLILWHKEKEVLEFELSEAKCLAQQKSTEASILFAKFQEAQATIADADSTVKALEFELAEAKCLALQKSVEASILLAKFQEAQATIADADSTVKALVELNENAKHQAEKYKQKESSFTIEKDDLLSEVSSLKMLLDVKELTYLDMENKFGSSLLEANEVALELEDGIRHLKNSLAENLEFVLSDIEWMKSKLQQFAELARAWLEENWLEIIGKDYAVSVLHLCHMGILSARITGLHAENGLLQRGIRESDSSISMLREHNDKAKNELEMCSVLKRKLLLDINSRFCCIAKKEQEATELSSRLDSFGKKVMHLQAQEKAMLARSGSMYNELSVLTEEIDATNRSSLAAQSKEKEELHNQLDKALFLNRMLKDTMLKVVSLPEVHTGIPANDINGCNEFELCSWLVNYHHESVMINTIKNDIESFVFASELEQHKVQLQKQNLMFTEVLERMKTEVTLWRVDQDLGSVAIYDLHEENSNIMIHLKNLKRDKDEVMESLLAMSKENPKLSYVIDSLESNIRSLQTDRDGKAKALMELQCSHAALCKELELKAKVIKLGISIENALKSENDSLRHEMLHILRKDSRMVDLVSNIDMEKLSVSIQACLEQITAQVQMYIDEQSTMMMKLSNDLNLVQLSVEELSTHNSSLQSELARKDELAKGLSFDLSILQESASVAKGQADQLVALAEAIKSLEPEVASKSHDLDNLVSGSQPLEAQIMKSNEKISVLEEQLASTVGELNAVSVENTELRSQLNHIERISYSRKEELAHRSNSTERMEEGLIELRNLLDERNNLFQNLQNDFSKLSYEKQYCDSQVLMLREKLEIAQAVAEKNEAIAMDARQIADERKTYAEKKDEEVKLLERSVDDLGTDVCAVENLVRDIKKEAERQRMQREELEVELQKVRQQMSAVPSSGEAGSSVEDKRIDLTDSFRHSRNVHNENELDEQQGNNHQSIELPDKRVTKISRSKTELDMHCTQQPMSNEDPRVQHLMEKLKRKQAAIRKARNYKNPSPDYSWVNSLG